MTTIRRFFVTLLLSLSSIALCARAAEIALEPPDGFLASSIDWVGGAQYCVTGEIIDDMNSTKTAWVALVDFSNKRLVWKTNLHFSPPFSGNYALHCTSGPDAFYVLTAEQTHTEESLAQTKLMLNKLGKDGRILVSKPINAGFDEWSYLLAADSKEIIVAGGTSDRLQRNGRMSTYLARFDTGLVRTKFTAMDSGAFWTDTKAMISSHRLRVAGQFMPNANGVSSGHRAFAVSQIDIDAKRYMFSTYVSPPAFVSEASDFVDDGTAYYVAATGTELIVSVVLPDGKESQHFAVKSTICDLSAIKTLGTTINLIGSTCDAKAESTLTAIDLTTRRARSVRSIPDTVSAANLSEDSWVILTSDKGRGIVLRRGDL
ncbi:hypothetical protein BG58_03755 [Caballeronia jiangsuensis]|nr:hypothetical protein BG58_03755 [Caballeronia jiangsuensis]